MTILRDDFIWGASTAAHQVEGDNVASDFWAVEHSPAGLLPEKSGSACDSFHRYREDISLAAAGGLKAYRFSIEWARIEPADGEFSRAALLHYRDMIDACHEHGLEPIITLHHFTCRCGSRSAVAFSAPTPSSASPPTCATSPRSCTTCAGSSPSMSPISST
ncbi:family 1 glycosylhydrolase [Actinomyces ruminis]|uniref:family 1 glycosylhydrolase n=1 Tax=Actinomyces ruminis TaxID=1937003 RepID=UPI001C558488|nr:family 1 glycosylhydrolase [Actinomyces ruminis]